MAVIDAKPVAVQADIGHSATSPDTPDAPLTFTELNRRMTAIPDYSDGTQKSPRRAKFGMALMLLSFALCTLVDKVLVTSTLKACLVVGLLATELTGVCINFWYSRGEFRTFWKPLEDFAHELDHDYPYHFEIRNWLTSQPLTELKKYASMARFRRDRFAQKLPIVAGSLSTLGILPVVLAIYLQTKELIAGRPLGWVDAIFGYLIVLVYYLTWVSSLSKARIEGMEMYLSDALTEAEERAGQD